MAEFRTATVYHCDLNKMVLTYEAGKDVVLYIRGTELSRATYCFMSLDDLKGIRDWYDHMEKEDAFPPVKEPRR